MNQTKPTLPILDYTRSESWLRCNRRFLILIGVGGLLCALAYLFGADAMNVLQRAFHRRSAWDRVLMTTPPAGTHALDLSDYWQREGTWGRRHLNVKAQWGRDFLHQLGVRSQANGSVRFPLSILYVGEVVLPSGENCWLIVWLTSALSDFDSGALYLEACTAQRSLLGLRVQQLDGYTSGRATMIYPSYAKGEDWLQALAGRVDPNDPPQVLISFRTANHPEGAVVRVKVGPDGKISATGVERAVVR